MPQQKEIADKTVTPAAVAQTSKKSVKKAKLPPKNNTGLPRRQKKAAQKAAARLQLA